jgi:thiol-disulfide isomerase/thioredoxin
MTQTLKTMIGFTAIALLVISCGGEKKENAQSGTTTDQTQANTPVPNTTAQPAMSAASATPDPSAVQFAALDVFGNRRQSTEWVTRQPVIINFWGTWCPPCRREIPDLVRIYDEYKPKGIEIVSLAVNDNPNSVKTYTANAGMKWVMLMGTDDIYERYGGIRGVPTTIFVDRNGKEIQRFVGARTYEVFKQAADKIL